MSLERKFSQLKNSPELQPNKDWEKTTKHELLSEIYSQNRLMKAQQLSSSEKVDLFMMKLARRLMPSTTKVLAGFLIVMIGSGTGFAAQASVPGEVLWPVKRSIEKAELTLAVSPVKETEVYIKHVNERLVEINKLIEAGAKESAKTPEKKAEKTKAIKQAIVYLEKDAAGVGSSLKVVKEEKKPLETVNLVKKVKETTTETRKKVESLIIEKVDKEENKEDAKILSEALADVTQINDEVQAKMVILAVEVHEEIVAQKAEKIAETAQSGEEVAQAEEVEAVTAVVTEIIAQEIDDLSNEIQVSKDQTADNENDQAVSGEVNTFANINDINDIKEQTAATEVILSEAKVLLEGGSIKDAADKILTGKEISKQTEEALKLNSINVDAINTATTTAGQINTHNYPTPANQNILTPTAIKASTTSAMDKKSVDIKESANTVTAE